MKKYNPKEIEKKWQKLWEENGLYKAVDFDTRPKKYVLVEFPYPSGDGLHVGHVRSYTALDAVARWYRMNGFNVLYPIGWDAFGLPTENYAIKNKIHPAKATEQNVKNFTRQIKSLGISFDWSREINTTDPAYYKWTQWIFLQFYRAGLAYRAEIAINWCPQCKVGLANEEVTNGRHERCGTIVVKKTKKQWLLAITKYADRLLQDLNLVDYPAHIKSSQINWIGKSEGALVKFSLKNISGQIDGKHWVEVFTTRADTLFGVSFIAVSPELAHKWMNVGWKADAKVKKYIEQGLHKAELDREKEKTGVNTGIVAVHPLSGKEIPVWVADYVLGGYGTGAVMGVPAHDKRDFEFATKFKLPIKCVIEPFDFKTSEIFSPLTEDPTEDHQKVYEEIVAGKRPYEWKGRLINSEEFNGLSEKEGAEKIIKVLEQNGCGKSAVSYKLRDWVFSRQHYWGEPIPIIHCEKCGEVALEEKDLPLLLPDVKHYEPTDSGESPLADIKEWVNVKCPKCQGEAKRETDTMPNWAGSNWYFCRYTDPKNDKAFADKKQLEYWMQVDLYNGGMEHTTLHLLYSRFVYKFLYDKGFVPGPEPYARRTSHGIVLAEDGRKMSKSHGNVINPDDVVKQFGADTLRLYEMFMAPYEQMVPWSSRSVIGVHRFLDRVWVLYQSQIKNRELKIKNKDQNKKNDELENGIKKLVKKITEDLGAMKFNTAVAAFMEFSNKMIKAQSVPTSVLETFLLLLAPFAPHICEELWVLLGNKNSIHTYPWPKASALAQDMNTILVVQINGRVRDTIPIKTGISQSEAERIVFASEKVKKYLGGAQPKKVIYTGKLINLVV